MTPNHQKRDDEERNRPVSAFDVSRTRRQQWGMIATVCGVVVLVVTSTYNLLYPRMLNDLRTEWRNDDNVWQATITKKFDREFELIHDQLTEIKTAAKETRTELTTRLDHIAEKVK